MHIFFDTLINSYLTASTCRMDNFYEEIMLILLFVIYLELPCITFIYLIYILKKNQSGYYDFKTSVDHYLYLTLKHCRHVHFFVANYLHVHVSIDLTQNLHT